MERAELLTEAKSSPTGPGVYLMKDERGVILYVGKAKNLRARITTYFQASEPDSPRTQLLVRQIHRFEVILTQTEDEALVLECTLIKKHKPKFNVRLKDDKSYPYLKISLGDSYPRLIYTRRVKKDGGRYFGPFPSAGSLRQMIQLLNETFKLRDCNDNTFRHRSRPCILFQMDRCTAPCVDEVSREAYREQLDQAIQVLAGEDDRLLRSLRQGMDDAAEKEEYELAAEYRDQIRNLEMITATQSADLAKAGVSMDVAGLARDGSYAHGVVLQIRNGRVIAARHFHLQNTDMDQGDEEVLRSFLAQYYLEAQKGEETIPQRVLIPIPLQVSDSFEKNWSLVPATSETPEEEQLIAVARNNAEHALQQQAKREQGHGMGALEEIQDKLHLPKIPYRIECYDISNIHGRDAVASRVVFVDGAPDKNLYRRYKIKTVEGSNDFAMMKEVLGRRFSRKEDDFPDLVVVDGGRGQLSQAVAILDELSVQGVEAVGLAKARTESDFKAKNVDSSLERIFIPNRKNPIPLRPNMEAYKLLVHIRDEAHRFAVSYHRLLRSKRQLK